MIQLVKQGEFGCYLDANGVTEVKTKAGIRRLHVVAIETYYRILCPMGKLTRWLHLCGTRGCCHPWHTVPSRPYAIAKGRHARTTNRQIDQVSKLMMTGSAHDRIRVAYDPRIACLPADVCQRLSEIMNMPREAIWAGWTETIKEDLRCQRHGDRARGRRHSEWVSTHQPELMYEPPTSLEALAWYDECPYDDSIHERIDTGAV